MMLKITRFSHLMRIVWWLKFLFSCLLTPSIRFRLLLSWISTFNPWIFAWLTLIKMIVSPCFKTKWLLSSLLDLWKMLLSCFYPMWCRKLKKKIKKSMKNQSFMLSMKLISILKNSSILNPIKLMRKSMELLGITCN